MSKTYLNYINGQWTPSSSGKTFPINNPAHRSQLLATCQSSNSTDVKLAIDAASKGLTEVVADPQATLDSATQKLKPFNLSILTAGTRNGAVHQTLRSSRLDAVLAEARQRYDYVVLDTPPLLPVFDSALLANAVDGVLMVVAANQTPRKLLGEALNMLDPGKVLGIVFNRDSKPMFGYYDAYYKDYFPEQVATEA